MAPRRLAAALLLALLTFTPAYAGGYPGAVAWPSCYSVPIYAGWTWSYPVAYVYAAPVLVTPGVPLAVPTPAPPSRAQMPPASKMLSQNPTTGPRVIEARSLAAGSAPASKDSCRVGFWNLTGRDVTLVVNGQTRTLPRDRAVTLDLPREFTWNIDARAGQAERVAADQAAYEVVIR